MTRGRESAPLKKHKKNLVTTLKADTLLSMTTNEAKNLIETLNKAIEEKAKKADYNLEVYKGSLFNVILEDILKSPVTPKQEIEAWIEVMKR